MKSPLMTTDQQTLHNSTMIRAMLHNRFIAYALLVSVLFGVSHLLGFRVHTSILSGTSSLSGLDQFYGALYLLLYLLFVTGVPISFLSGVVIVGINHLKKKRY